MHCNQCGKENRLDSKFCRYCGKPLLEISENKFTIFDNEKNKLILFVLGALICLGVIFYGGTKAYAYYQVQSKISNAKGLQTLGGFTNSLSVLGTITNYSPTVDQQKDINIITADDEKFITFQTSFNAAVALESTTTSISDNLQTALADLQSIDSSYPQYKDVQTEITKVQSLLLEALQNDANASKKAAADAEAQATSAAAAKVQAEENAEKAQSEADSAAADAKAEADANSIHQVDQAFYNQLQSIYDSVNGDGITDYNNGNDDYNLGTTLGNLDAIDAYSDAEAIYKTAYNESTDLKTEYTNMPASYSTAAADLASAASDYYQAASIAMTDAGNAQDGLYTSPNSYTTDGNTQKNNVLNFLNSTTP